MAEEGKLCAATTKRGAPCKNGAQSGADYCYVHRNLAVAVPAAAAPSPADPQTPSASPHFNELVRELNEVMHELHAQIPDYTPPDFSPSALVALLRENLHRFTPEVQLDIARQLKANLEGTSPKDLVDPETWKGMWYILNYSIGLQSEALKDRLATRLAALPGVATLTDLRNNLEGASPKDLLDVDTWKGAWYILNHSLRHQAGEIKRKLLGQEASE